MAEQLQFTCDRCGAVKGAANHWFRVWAKWNGGYGIAVARWDAGRIHEKERHICGDKCLLAEVQEFADGKPEDPARLEMPLAMED